MRGLQVSRFFHEIVLLSLPVDTESLAESLYQLFRYDKSDKNISYRPKKRVACINWYLDLFLPHWLMENASDPGGDYEMPKTYLHYGCFDGGLPGLLFYASSGRQRFCNRNATRRHGGGNRL
jgi:hypothetical protein